MIVKNLQTLGLVFFMKHNSTDINLTRYAAFLCMNTTTLLKWFEHTVEPSDSLIKRILNRVNDMMHILTNEMITVDLDMIKSIDFKERYFNDKIPIVPQGIIDNLLIMSKSSKAFREIPLLRYLPASEKNISSAKVGNYALDYRMLTHKQSFALRLGTNTISNKAEQNDFIVCSKDLSNAKLIAVNYQGSIWIGKPINNKCGKIHLFVDEDNVVDLNLDECFQVSCIIKQI